jgi:hypothetical protein
MPVKARWAILPLVLAALGIALAAPRLSVQSIELPTELSDAAFWQLVIDTSEPGGTFRGANITNLTSNELWFQQVIPELVSRATPGGVYLGVGPEQNFTYLAALRPKMAIIFDIRRGNLDLHLMYKAMFELSADRADFVAMLFSKPRPEGLAADVSAAALFSAFAAVPSSHALYERNLAAIERQLTAVHGFTLLPDDVVGVREIYTAFYRSGFYVRSSPSYDALMTATDHRGEARSYLASEANFAVVKHLQTRNLVVPVVGNFSGPTAIRAVGAYLGRHTNATVSAFYLSNVEQYLDQAGSWETFCRNVATLPLDGSSTFIRSSNRGNGFGRGFALSLGGMAAAARSCSLASRSRLRPSVIGRAIQ